MVCKGQDWKGFVADYMGVASGPLYPVGIRVRPHPQGMGPVVLLINLIVPIVLPIPLFSIPSFVTHYLSPFLSLPPSCI